VLRRAQRELGFSLEVIPIDGDDELERRHRVRVPVVEVDGEEAFVYEVDVSALRALLRD
jgi:hypothetical protein